MNHYNFFSHTPCYALKQYEPDYRETNIDCSFRHYRQGRPNVDNYCDVTRKRDTGIATSSSPIILALANCMLQMYFIFHFNQFIEQNQRAKFKQCTSNMRDQFPLSILFRYFEYYSNCFAKIPQKRLRSEMVWPYSFMSFGRLFAFLVCCKYVI